MPLSLERMSLARRIEIGGMLGLVAAGLALTVAGAAAAAMGAELPGGLAGALTAAGDVLGWARWLVIAALVYGVVKVRETAEQIPTLALTGRR